MMISTRGRYALRVLVDMAENQKDGYIPLKDIAARQEISEKYLESIVKILVKEKIVTAVRGKGGGYRLGRLPEEISVERILILTEGSLAPVACIAENPVCQRMPDCRTLNLWRGLDQVVHEYLAKYSVRDLMSRTDGGFDYVI
ncbi:MAG: Rrf2 family transcriptional regulator [Hungatella sp.]|nr:Rrf2 family transcriptional regulator [Hungatella sp.]MCI9502033.1 Rrf2 family transcriptional regulator [Hungatella sp.]